MPIPHLQHRTTRDGIENDDDEIADNDEDLDDDPILEYKPINHDGGVNRIRSMPQQSNIVATWSDTKAVHIWDISQHLTALVSTARKPS